MIRSLIAALALSTLAIPQVKADASYTHANLLQDFRNMGGRVYIDSELCNKYPGVFGLQQAGTIHICTEPHKGDTAELNDTIRHELWHVVQYCHGGPITEGHAAAIISDAYAKGWTERGYKAGVWHLEAEAHYVAATRSAKEISQALTKSCS